MFAVFELSLRAGGGELDGLASGDDNSRAIGGDSIAQRRHSLGWGWRSSSS